MRQDVWIYSVSIFTSIFYNELQMGKKFYSIMHWENLEGASACVHPQPRMKMPGVNRTLCWLTE